MKHLNCHKRQVIPSQGQTHHPDRRSSALKNDQQQVAPASLIATRFGA
ncbi:MAG: hypothetical protein KME16_00960 [Scytolyngbya sp. HA4215-MV1]|nr:hypothetical protein [Scytolyngbya sp. HA4215-MV1]